jgi:hypothetical protein
MGLTANAAVNGYTTLPGALTPAQLYMGLTDVAAVDIATLTGPSPATLTDANTVALYRAAVYPMMFTGGTILRVNPTPDTPDLRSYQVAQQHPYFSEGVSDFIIDLAGDFDTVGGLPGEIDRVGAGEPGEGNIKWFSHWYNEPPGTSNPTGRRRDPAGGPDLAHDPNLPDAWEPNAPTYDSTPGAPGPAIADGAFVFQHSTPANPNTRDTWPHMIRIRWRQHDHNGKVTTTTSSQPPYPGKWFEQIVPVNRN